MPFTIVSFYTKHTPYEKEVKNLVTSLEKAGVKYYVEGVESFGSWEKNCQYKAEFILKALNNFNTNIVWIDADAVVMRYPLLFDELDCDIAYHYLSHRNELLSGTLFVKNNDKMRVVSSEWIKLNASNREWDQKNLQKVVEADSTIDRFILPAAYCKIYDNHRQQVTDPVVMHYQASRRFKRSIRQTVISKRR